MDAEKLVEIERKMHECTIDRDHEAAHGYADSLLYETVELLRKEYHPNTKVARTIKRILAEYDNVEGWYA